MTRWTSLTAWSRLSENLSVSVGREFEKAVLPWLQIIWPTLTQPPEIGHWDKRGVDLASWSDDFGLDVVVQCKGYEVTNVGQAQLRQARESIAKFRDTDTYANTYVFIYNRPGKNRDFHTEIEQHAAELVSLGRVKKVEVWSREMILRNIFDAAAQTINAQLTNSAHELRRRLEHVQDTTLPLMTQVPIRASELRFKRDEPCKIVEVLPLDSRDSEQTLLAGEGFRWTLVVGNFGAGKTTAVLKASANEDLVPIYVSAKALNSEHLRTGTSRFLTEVLRTTGLYSKVPAAITSSANVEEMWEKLAGSILGYLLRLPDSPHVLILDALDENRVYCTLDGVQHLSNQLAEFRCRIILTTRREQLAEQFGNFSVAMGEASVKYGPKRPARLLELEEWTPKMVRPNHSRVNRDSRHDEAGSVPSRTTSQAGYTWHLSGGLWGSNS